MRAEVNLPEWLVENPPQTTEEKGFEAAVFGG
jgi:hypothetical protein